MSLWEMSEPSSCGSPSRSSIQKDDVEKKKIDALEKLCQICGYESSDSQSGGKRPLRILFVGKHGVGKSSFINGVAAALSEDRWREFAYTGDIGSGAPITIANQKFEKCCNGDRPRYQNVLLPTLIDVAGLADESDEIMEELLRLLFYGHIKEGESLMSVYVNCRRKSKEQIRLQYSDFYPDLKADRVVFVASAADRLPVRLMDCVRRAARPSFQADLRRAVPLFGVLTKMDKFDTTDIITSSEDVKKTFIRSLGLNSSRIFACRNYCDDLDPDGERTQTLDPSMDLPYIRFMQTLSDSALSVIHDLEDLPIPINDQQNDPWLWLRATLDGDFREPPLQVEGLLAVTILILSTLIFGINWVSFLFVIIFIIWRLYMRCRPLFERLRLAFS